MFILTRGFFLCISFSNPTFLITWLVILRFLLGLFFLRNLSNWIMYVVVLLFTGGIIILFTYITSLVISSKINFPSIPWLMFIIVLPLTIAFSHQERTELSIKNISRLYFDFSNIILMFITLYLVIVLISIVKIATSLYGPIKSFFAHEK